MATKLKDLRSYQVTVWWTAKRKIIVDLKYKVLAKDDKAAIRSAKGTFEKIVRGDFIDKKYSVQMRVVNPDGRIVADNAYMLD